MKFNLLTGLIIAASNLTANYVFADNSDPLAHLPYFNKTSSGYQLTFEGNHYRTIETDVNGKKIKFRAFEKIVYVQHPIEPEYQTINFYVPEDYFHNKVLHLIRLI